MPAWCRCAPFPIAAPDEGVSLVNTEGHEVAWIDSLQAWRRPPAR
jgi:hypothetical protein